jgi:formate hydrogenlyase subunit 4
MNVLYVILQIIIALVMAPFFTGVIKKLKAFSQHRRGVPLLQPYYDLAKLFRKELVASETTSWIYRVAPYIYFTTAVTACIFVPFIFIPQKSSGLGDAILMVYLLALGRFFLTLAGLDAGSTFGGMGSSREIMISAVIEPAIILVIFTLGAFAGTTDFSGILAHGGGLNPGYLFTFVALLIILLAETCRIPVDDPSTHLELTMVHEAMLLEYSGKHLALMEWGAWIKQLLFMGLIANLFLPLGPGETLLFSAPIIFFIKVTFIAIVVGLIEINSVKLKLFRVPRMGFLALTMSLMGFLTYFFL